MDKVRFLTINEFKTQIEAESIDVLHNTKTGKLFMSANGETFKVQQDIDSSKEMKVLIPEGEGLSEACLVNVSAGAETKFTL